METFLMAIPNVVMENPEIVSVLLGITGTSWVASLITVFTKTRKSKWYKLVELLAFVWGKAKEEYKESK